jgi:vacuolar protein sorting-associated protein 13A/C
MKFSDNRWESVVGIKVDSVGRKLFGLNMRTSGGTRHRLICDIQLRGNMKIVTLRSGTRIYNCTKLPLEISYFESSASQQQSLQNISIIIKPGDFLSVPIIEAYESRFRMRPSGTIFKSFCAPYYFYQLFQGILGANGRRMRFFGRIYKI